MTDVPTEFLAAVEGGDYDAALAWLQTNPWPLVGGFLELVDDVIVVFLRADPATAVRLIAQRLDQTEDADERLEVEIRLVDALCRSAQVEEARTLLVAIRTPIESVPDIDRRHTIWSNIASFFQRAGAITDARQILGPIAAQRRTVNSSELDEGGSHLTAVTLLNLATIEANPAAGNLDLALELLAEARSYATNTTTMGNIEYNLGFISVQTGDIASATDAYGKAADHFEAAGGDPIDVAYAMRGQAGLFGRVGRIAEATATYEEAIDKFLDAGAFEEAARTDIGLLMSLAMSGEAITDERLETSRARLQQAAPTDIPELLMNIANVESNRSDFQAAYKTLTAARQLFRKAGRNLDVARADLSRAAMLRKLDRVQTARRIAQRSLRTFQANGRSKLVAHAWNNLANIFDDLGRPSDAVDSIVEAITELDAHRHGLPSAHDRLTLGSVTYPNLFNLAFKLTKDEPYLRAALIERSRIQPVPPAETGQGLVPPPPVAVRPGARVVPGHGATRFLHDASGSADAHRLSWAVSGNELLRCHLTGTRTIIDQVTLAPDLLRTLELSLARPTNDEIENTPDLETARRLGLYRAARGPLLGDETLAERLKPTLLHSHRVQVEAHNPLSTETLLEQLSDLLIPPTFRSALSETVDSRVAIAPPPELGRVPWAALLVNDRCLIELASVEADLPIALRGNHSPAPGPGTNRPLRGLWVGDPTGDLHYCRRTPTDPWQTLTSTTKPAATRDALVAELATAPDVFVYRGHIAAGTATEPAAAHLNLSDGSMLRADELNVSGSGPVRCFLLGCDAPGATSGVEWTGIATGFVWSGTTELITTQWEVIDRPEQEILDFSLVRACLESGTMNGLRSWQRDHAERWRTTADGLGPYMWANPVAIMSGPRTRLPGPERLDTANREAEALTGALM